MNKKLYVVASSVGFSTMIQVQFQQEGESVFFTV